MNTGLREACLGFVWFSPVLNEASGKIFKRICESFICNEVEILQKISHQYVCIHGSEYPLSLVTDIL